MTTTAVLFLRLFVVLALFRAIGLPIARAAFPRLTTSAYALATSVALVLSAHVTWLLAYAGVRIGWISIGAGIVATALGSLVALRHVRARGVRLLPTLRVAAVVHIAGAVAFALALAVTARNPSVDPDSERFMDYAMVNAVVTSRTLPLEDPWLCAERVSYYDYGYYATAHLSILVGAPERFFLVAVALLFEALFVGVTALGLDLAGPIGAFLAGFLVCLAGNLDAAVQTLSRGLSVGLDWFRSARVVEGSITEFPYFTLLWGDLHPYALALPLWPLLLAVVATLLAAVETAPPASRDAPPSEQPAAAVPASTSAAAESTAAEVRPAGETPADETPAPAHPAAAAPVAGAPVATAYPAGPVAAASAFTVGAGAVAYAALVATHTWDAVPVAALLGLVAAFAAVLSRPGTRARSAARPIAVVVAGLALAIPFLLHAPTGGRGLAWVQKRSSLAELATAWGGPLALLLPAALVAGLRRPSFRERAAPLFAFVVGYVVISFANPGIGIAFAAAAGALLLAATAAGTEALTWMLAATGAGLVAGVELLYVDDFYTGDLERMNTVFKAYTEAWVLLGLAAALATPALLASARRVSRLRLALTFALVAAVVASTSLYPLRATHARCGSLLEPIGLDARIAFRQIYPDDAAAADMLRGLPRGRLLETTDGPYSWNGRFATFTGYPAVVGWAHHEAGWRNDWTLPMERAAEVRDAYSEVDPGKLREVVRRHDLAYVVVGALERQQYPPRALEKFKSLEPVVRAGGTVVYAAGNRR